AYQNGTIRSDPPDTLAFVPTAAMLSGDFTDFASPACNVGRQITLRAPFLNKRVDPALFSKAVLFVAAKLPKTADPCGRIIFGSPNVEDRSMAVGRIDYQRSTNHSLFGRYLQENIFQPTPYSINHNLLSASTGLDGRSEAFTIGDTYLFAANVINSMRLSANHYTGGYTDYDRTVSRAGPWG